MVRVNPAAVFAGGFFFAALAFALGVGAALDAGRGRARQGQRLVAAAARVGGIALADQVQAGADDDEQDDAAADQDALAAVRAADLALGGGAGAWRVPHAWPVPEPGERAGQCVDRAGEASPVRAGRLFRVAELAGRARRRWRVAERRARGWPAGALRWALWALGAKGAARAAELAWLTRLAGLGCLTGPGGEGVTERVVATGTARRLVALARAGLRAQVVPLAGAVRLGRV